MFLLWSSYSHPSLLDMRHNLSLFFMAPKHWRETHWSFFSLMNFYLRVHKSTGIVGKKNHHSVGTRHQTVKKKKFKNETSRTAKVRKRKLSGNYERLIVQDPQNAVSTRRNCLEKLLSFRRLKRFKQTCDGKRLHVGEEQSAKMRNWRENVSVFRIRFHG